MAEKFYVLIVCFLVFQFIIARILDLLNHLHRSEEIPEAVKDSIDQEEYTRNLNYQNANQNFRIFSSTLSLMVTVGLILSGAFGKLDTLLRTYSENPILLSLMFFGIIGAAGEILGLPFSIYRTFVIEKKFGFNKTTLGTFIVDRLKGYVLAILIGGGLLALITWIYYQTGSYFWLLGWAVLMAFSIFGAMFYTTLLLPLFNKLTPLKDGELRNAIIEYAKKINFPIRNIMVMDGSKRSTKGNAFFSGLGPKKTIVLFDTLIEKHSAEELVAVLAHEVGHYKKKHILKNMLLSGVTTGILFYLLGVFVSNPALALALGGKVPSFHLGLLGFSLLYSPVSFVLGIATNYISRVFEYEADAFARETYSGTSLRESLKKLSLDSFSNLTPHPAYVFVHYSHPPVLKRMAALSD